MIYDVEKYKNNYSNKNINKYSNMNINEGFFDGVRNFYNRFKDNYGRVKKEYEENPTNDHLMSMLKDTWDDVKTNARNRIFGNPLFNVNVERDKNGNPTGKISDGYATVDYSHLTNQNRQTSVNNSPPKSNPPRVNNPTDNKQNNQSSNNIQMPDFTNKLHGQPGDTQFYKRKNGETVFIDPDGKARVYGLDGKIHNMSAKDLSDVPGQNQQISNNKPVSKNPGKHLYKKSGRTTNNNQPNNNSDISRVTTNLDGSMTKTSYEPIGNGEYKEVRHTIKKAGPGNAPTNNGGGFFRGLANAFRDGYNRGRNNNQPNNNSDISRVTTNLDGSMTKTSYEPIGNGRYKEVRHTVKKAGPENAPTNSGGGFFGGIKRFFGFGENAEFMFNDYRDHLYKIK